jgi:putative ABC transport system substrate-binding protein
VGNRASQRRLAFALAACAFAVPAGGAEVAVLRSHEAPAYNSVLAGFKKGLGPMGGSLVEYDLNDAGTDVVARLTAQNPGVVVAIGARAAQTLLGAKLAVPVVFCAFPEAGGPALSGPLATGVILEVPVTDQLAALKRFAPRVRRVAVLYTPDHSRRAFDDAAAAAPYLAIDLVAATAKDKTELLDAHAAVHERADAFWLPADASLLTRGSWDKLLAETLRRKQPVMAADEALVAGGALLSVAPDLEAAGMQAAELTKALLGGKRPAELPPVRAKSRVVVNRSTAKALGLPLGPELLKDAKLVE